MSASSTATPCLGQPLGDGSPARLTQRRHERSAADQRDLATLLGEFGGRLGAGQPGADNRDRCIRVQLVQRVAQPLRVLEFRYRISEFGGTRNRRRGGAGTAHRIDDVVVVQHRGPRRAGLCASAVSMRVGAVDHQSDALAEQRAVVDGGIAVRATNWCSRIRSTNFGRGFTSVMSTSARSRRWLAASVPAYPPPMTTTCVRWAVMMSPVLEGIVPSRHRGSAGRDMT